MYNDVKGILVQNDLSFSSIGGMELLLLGSLFFNFALIYTSKLLLGSANSNVLVNSSGPVKR